MSTMPAVNKAKPRWADLCDSSSENLGARLADISDSSVESRPSRLLLEDTSYEEQSAGALGLSDLLREGAAFPAEEPRKRTAVAESSLLAKKARREDSKDSSGNSDAEGKHVAADAAAAGSSLDQPQDRIAQLRQLGFEGIPESMLKEQLDLMGGSIQKVVKVLEEHRSVEEQAKQRRNATPATEDAAKEKLLKLQQMGFDESEQVLTAKLEENGGDMQKVVEVLLQKRAEKPTSGLDKRHGIIKNIKERRDSEINYPYFNAKRPREKRIPIREPMTPDPNEDMSKRQWEAEVAYWREGLRKWNREHGGV